MWDILLRAIALMLVIEGIMPFIAPNHWRNMIQTISQMDNNTLRKIGFISMLAGITVLFIANKGLS